MPIYEYRCENCGKFEHIQKINDEPFNICPKCGGAVRRLISKAGIVFKGSGFHITDYKKEKNTETTGSTKSTETPKETKSSPKEASPKKSE
jgi:putative FmdB family regulatory protein